MKLRDIKGATEKSGLTVDQLHWLIKKGSLPACQPGGPGGKHYIKDDDLEALMQPVQRGQK